jgi:hypothetical protein
VHTKSSNGRWGANTAGMSLRAKESNWDYKPIPTDTADNSRVAGVLETPFPTATILDVGASGITDDPNGNKYASSKYVR